MVTLTDVRRYAMTLPLTTEALVGGDPTKFMQPQKSDLRYNWVLVRLDKIDETEMRELVLDAWRMVVPKRVAAALDPEGISGLDKR